MVQKIIVGVFVVWSSFMTVSFAQAQEVHQEFQELVKAEVLEVVDQYERDIMGTNATTTVQELRIQLLSGVKTGEVARFENDLVVLEVGDEIFVNRLESIDGTEYYIFKDIERRPALLWLFIIFVALVIGLSGRQGVRALLSLGLSVAAIFYLLLPALLAGYDPAVASLLIAGLILAASLFLTHGFKPRVVVTFFGTFGAVACTCLLAYVFVKTMRFTGFSADSSVYLNFASGGTIDLAGLLLGSIIIGLLGLLDDVSITQASVVEALKGANPSFRFADLYSRAIGVGKDHVGSLVNTLALAYVGAALPLLLLYTYSQSSFLVSINQEVIAAEIVRIMVGSIGLILAVPLTTALAAWYFQSKEHIVVEHDHGHDHHHGHHH